MWQEGLRRCPQWVKNLPANAGETGQLGSIPGQEHPLEEGTATHSSISAWRIPWREEPAAAATAKSLQSCPTLCNPINASPPGSTIPGILQARTLEWVAISFSNAWKWKVKVKSLSCVWLLATPWTAAHQAPPSMGFSRQEYWSSLLLPLLSHFSRIQLCDPIDGSPPGSPIPEILQTRTLEWMPFPSPMHESEKSKWSRSVVSDS